VSRLHLTFVSLLFAFFVSSGSASAQISNKPFDFGSSGGVGMSVAGKQAIMNQKLFGSTPSVLLKGPNGHLLGLANGPGSTAIVTSPSGELLPGYKGRGWSSGSWGAGTFNAFFAGARGSDSLSIASNSSGASVDSWTGQVLSGSSFGGSGSSVDQWTDMVYW